MLYVDDLNDALSWFHYHKHPLKGVVIYNGIASHYGETRARTKFDYDSEYYSSHEDTYISYDIPRKWKDGWKSDKKVQEGLNEVFEEQKNDLPKIKKIIWKNFPDIPIFVTLSPYSSLFYKGEITGENLYEDGDKSQFTEEMKRDYQRVMEHYKYWNDKYQNVKHLKKIKSRF